MHRSGLTALTLLLVAGACGEPTSPQIPGRVEILPPAQYAAWWEDVERCSTVQGDFSRVRWYSVRSFPERPNLLGQWNSNHEITLRDDLLDAYPIVAHEILHELLDGDRAHQDLAWINCGLPIGTGGG